MEIIGRKQVTQIVTERHVSHEVMYNGSKYVRRKMLKLTIDYMDTNVSTKHGVTWHVYIKHNVIDKVPKSLAKELEELFNKQPIEKLNGN